MNFSSMNASSSYFSLITWRHLVEFMILVDCSMIQGPLFAFAKQCWREVSNSMFGIAEDQVTWLDFSLHSLLTKELQSKIFIIFTTV